MTKKDNKYIAAGLIVIAIVSAVGIGFASRDDSKPDTASTETVETGSHTHSDDDGHSEEGHDHSKEYEFASHEGLPDVGIESLERNDQGEWVLMAAFSNFEIREDKVDQENVPGEGHAHVYVNGEKVSRLFGEEYIFENELLPGDTVTVGLNTNDHQAYVHEGALIEDQAIVN